MENEHRASVTKNYIMSTLPFIVVLLIAVLGFIGYVYLIPKNELMPDASLDEQEVVNTDVEPNYTIEEVSFDIADIAPNVNRPIQFGAAIPENVRTMLTAQAGEIRTRLSTDLYRADDWLNLALIYHTANDYQGAREVWEFVIKVIPENTTAYDNLARLYHLSLKDFAKSEGYFNKSLSIDPYNINALLGLFELYRYSYKTETTAAVDIMNTAIGRYPDRLDLVLTLGVYYAEKENYSKAREVLEDGLNKARDAGDVNMIDAFGDEIERLPQ